MPTDTMLTFAAVGDVALSHQYQTILQEKGPDYPFAHVRSFLEQYDIVLANLEAPFTRTGKTYPLKCSLKADPDYVTGLKNAGINVVSLANNHILDYQVDAMYDTMHLLKQNGILFFGAGKNLSEARNPAVFEKNGASVGFLGYCDVTIDSPFYASTDERGIAPFNMQYVHEDIALLRPHVDFLVLSLHWGEENISVPSPRQLKMGRACIDAGADMIIGHHPHVVQRVEKYAKGYIAYSLGNFLFSDITWTWQNEKGENKTSYVALKPENRRSLIISCDFNKHGLNTVDLHSSVINENLQACINGEKQMRIKPESNRIIDLDCLLFALHARLKTIKGQVKRLKGKIKKAKALLLKSNAQN